MEPETRICRCGCGEPIAGKSTKEFKDRRHKDRFYYREARGSLEILRRPEVAEALREMLRLGGHQGEEDERGLRPEEKQA